MKKTLLLVLCIAVAACSKDPAAEREARVKRGDELLAEGKVADATLEYRAAVAAEPASGIARRKLGLAYLQSEDPGRAVAELVRAADYLPDDVDAQLEAGRALLLARQFEDARARADKVLARDPRNVSAHILKGNALGGLRDFEAAFAEVQQAIDANPTDANAYSHLATLQMGKGDTASAEASFKRAIAADPKSVSARLALANLYWSSNRPSLAESTIKEALVLEPANQLANKFLAGFYLGSRRLKEAEAPLQAVAAAGGWREQLALGDYYSRLSRFNDAKAIYDKLADGTAGASAAKVRLASLGMLSGNLEEARRITTEVLTREPNNVEALIGRAQIEFREGRVAESLATARMATSAGPQVPLAHFVLGKMLQSQHQMDEAKAAFENALKAFSGFAPANVELARIAILQNRPQDAIRFAQAAIDRVPSFGDAHLLLARAHLLAGNPDGADAPLRLMKANFPDSAIVLAEVGRLHLAKGDRAAARTALNAAITKDPVLPAAVEALVGMDIQEKRVDAARARLDSAVAQAPANAELQLMAARMFATTFGDRPAAEAAVKRVLAAQPNNLTAFDVLARIYATSADLPAATAEFEKLAERQPRSVGNHTAIGVLYQLRGDLDKAKAAYERALSIDGRAGVAANNLANIYADRNENLDVALQLAKTAKAALRDSHEVDDTLGWLYYKKGQAREALTPLKAAVSAQPDNALYLYHLGAAQALARDRSGARQSLERALKLQSNFPGADDARKILESLKN
jgi:tetratricopeptide (TPR) repeat protein